MTGADILPPPVDVSRAAAFSWNAADLMTPHCVLPNLAVGSKKASLSLLARQAAEISGLNPDEIYRALLARERLGSTGVGGGVGIPHARFPGLVRLRIVFARLAHPIDFDSVDDLPVDLLFLLLTPDNDTGLHLKALSKVTRLLRDPVLCRTLRQTKSRDGLCAALIEMLSA